jgi:hypothetical protein
MEYLPTEISQQIYGLACTDNGATGRSLSLVSKRVHDTSKPLKLQSIAIESAKHAVGFALLLQNTPSHLRNVVYLSVTNDGHFGRALDSPDTPDHDTPNIFRRISRRVSHFLFGVASDNFGRDMDCRHQLEQTLFDAFFRILTSIASTIRHVQLSYFQMLERHPFQSNSVIPALPVLRSLKLSYFAPFRVDILPHLLTPLCSLKYLNITNLGAKRDQISAFGLGEYLAKQTPSLTHLKVSTEVAMGLFYYRLGGTTTNRLPSSLERVLIGPVSAGDIEDWDYDGSAMNDYLESVSLCREFARQDDRIVILDEEDGDELEEFYPLGYPSY